MPVNDPTLPATNARSRERVEARASQDRGHTAPHPPCPNSAFDCGVYPERPAFTSHQATDSGCAGARHPLLPAVVGRARAYGDPRRERRSGYSHRRPDSGSSPKTWSPAWKKYSIRSWPPSTTAGGPNTTGERTHDDDRRARDGRPSRRCFVAGTGRCGFRSTRPGSPCWSYRLGSGSVEGA
jgi:hypothetical protein